MMSRNFGMTSGAAPGEKPRPHSLGVYYSTDADNVIALADYLPPGQPNSGRGLAAAPLSFPRTPFERSTVVQAPIDIGVMLFWLFYICVAFTGFWFACWALALVILRSIGL